MKLNKELVKRGFKNQFETILHMLIFNLISLVLFWIENLGARLSENVWSSKGSYISMYEYNINVLLVIISWIMFLVISINFYTRFFKKDFKEQIKTHWSFTILFIVTTAIFALVEVVIYVLILVISIGIFSVRGNYPTIVPIVVLAYIMVYIVRDCIREIKQKIKNKNDNENNNEDNNEKAKEIIFFKDVLGDKNGNMGRFR